MRPREMTQRCEKVLQSGRRCAQPAVARVIPSVEDHANRGWLACVRHADRAMTSMRSAHVDEAAHVRPIQEG